MLISTKPTNYKDITVEQPAFERLYIPAAIIRAAQIFVDKNEVRWYLRGLHFNPRGYIEATNGHFAIRIECEECKRLSAPILVNIKGTKIPAKAKDLELVSMGPWKGVVLMTDKKTGKSLDDVRSFEVVKEGGEKYPDIDRVMPKGELEPVNSISFNAMYMKEISEAQSILNGSRSFNGIDMRFRGKTGIIEINIPSPFYKATVILMPIADIGV